MLNIKIAVSAIFNIASDKEENFSEALSTRTFAEMSYNHRKMERRNVASKSFPFAAFYFIIVTDGDSKEMTRKW